MKLLCADSERECMRLMPFPNCLQILQVKNLKPMSKIQFDVHILFQTTDRH